MKNIAKYSSGLIKGLVVSLIVVLAFTGILPAQDASAATWSAGRIIDDSVFTNNNSMTTTQIQNFLDGKNSVCLKDFQTPSILGSNNYGSDVSAAKAIKQASDLYGINPKVILVTLQKEQGLITTQNCYFSNGVSKRRTAMGFGCPDTAPCDSQWYGLSRQLFQGARHLDGFYEQKAGWYVPFKPGNRYIQWHPKSSCGGKTVDIKNRATASLYSYTPYQPNSAAINAGFGTGNSCSSYGNRNFWLYYNAWFGSTLSSTPAYAWELVSKKAYRNSSRTNEITGEIIMDQNSTVYTRVRLRNTGYQTWEQSSTRIGTALPLDRNSSFSDGSWLSSKRATSLEESTVNPGETGTFDFTLNSTSNAGSYAENFGLVVEGLGWAKNTFGYAVQVALPVAPQDTQRSLSATESLGLNERLLSSDLHSALWLRKDGNLVLFRDYDQVWESDTAGSGAIRLLMQSDGNLVLQTNSNSVVWSSSTAGHTGATLQLQTDGNLVVYDSSTPVWESDTHELPDGLDYVISSVSEGTLLPGQMLRIPSQEHRLVFQDDGNLVIYTSNNKALWSTRTHGHPGAILRMQDDGNLVIYAASGRALWSSKTSGHPGATLILQNDRNLVIYAASGRALWSSKTYSQ